MTDDIYPMTAREAANEYLDHIKMDVAESTVESHQLRLRHFVRWCENQEIEHLHELNGREIHRYERKRRGDGLAATTLKSELMTLRQYLRFGARLEALDDDVAEKVEPPTPTKQEEVSESILRADRALDILDRLRDDEFGSRDHAMLELMWNTAARRGAIAGLDVDDYYPEDQYVEFRHRPELGTPLKNQYSGERPVSLSDRVCDALDAYLTSDDRWNQRDQNGREPLLTSRRGRPSAQTITQWMYQITVPCRYRECPHDRDPEECEALVNRNAESNCPSSRSSHPVRSGSISWQLSCGIPLELVEARVDASREVILRHYDLRGARQKMEQRRNHILPALAYQNPA